jgi:hypothetical protein
MALNRFHLPTSQNIKTSKLTLSDDDNLNEPQIYPTGGPRRSSTPNLRALLVPSWRYMYSQPIHTNWT